MIQKKTNSGIGSRIGSGISDGIGSRIGIGIGGGLKKPSLIKLNAGVNQDAEITGSKINNNEQKVRRASSSKANYSRLRAGQGGGVGLGKVCNLKYILAQGTTQTRSPTSIKKAYVNSGRSRNQSLFTGGSWGSRIQTNATSNKFDKNGAKTQN